jgi:dihydropyrimidinase
MSLLIRHGEIVTAESRYSADILCAGEQISRIGKDLEAPPACTVIDATGKLVFPGFIDPHVHIHLPVMGTSAKDTWESASRAALVGGTTTLIEMVNPTKSEEPLAAYHTSLSKAEGHSACDYSFHIGVSRCDALAESQLREIVRQGISSFKIFLAYQGTLGLDDRELNRALGLAKQLGVITTAHCENAEIVQELQRRLLAEGKTGPQWHYWSRPPWVEAEGTRRLMSFATLHDAHIYVVHLSCEEALNEVVAARRQGLKAWAETVIQHLILDKSDAERPGFEGAKYVMSPPLRDRKNQEVLWNALQEGAVSTVASDHAPFDFATQKTMGIDDFTRIPNGIPSLQDRVNLFYTRGVAEGRIDLHRFVDAASTQAARLFGLFPRKGAIAIGSDADLVIYDPGYEGIISAATQLINVDYSPFEGMTIKGRPSVVTVRGEITARDGQFIGTIGRGQFLPRDPTHF